MLKFRFDGRITGLLSLSTCLVDELFGERQTKKGEHFLGKIDFFCSNISQTSSDKNNLSKLRRILAIKKLKWDYFDKVHSRFSRDGKVDFFASQTRPLRPETFYSDGRRKLLWQKFHILLSSQKSTAVGSKARYCFTENSLNQLDRSYRL